MAAMASTSPVDEVMYPFTAVLANRDAQASGFPRNAVIAVTFGPSIAIAIVLFRTIERFALVARCPSAAELLARAVTALLFEAIVVKAAASSIIALIST